MSKPTTRIIYIIILVLAFILLIIFYPSGADARPQPGSRPDGAGYISAEAVLV